MANKKRHGQQCGGELPGALRYGCYWSVSFWSLSGLVHTVSTERAVRFGHQRRDIENYGFNDLVNGWHADHIYKHDSNAIECFLLIAFLACNIFQAFLVLNLKPQIRKGRTRIFWAKLMEAEIYAEIKLNPSP